MTVSLNWIIDPICGWSYGVLPLIKAVQEKFPELQHFHLGGLYIGSSRQAMTLALRDRIVQYDLHIHQMTGVVFGDDYKNQLLCDPSLVLDSFAATRALLTAKKYLRSDQFVVLLDKIQTSYYQNGFNITQPLILNELMETWDLGVTTLQWQSWLAETDITQVTQEVLQARELMSQVNGQGFPTLVFQQDENVFTKINVAEYYHRPNELIHDLTQQLDLLDFQFTY